LNALADNGEFKKITERINGGTNGLLARIERLDAAKNALAV
jgi:predicted chitinase